MQSKERFMTRIIDMHAHIYRPEVAAAERNWPGGRLSRYASRRCWMRTSAPVSAKASLQIPDTT